MAMHDFLLFNLGAAFGFLGGKEVKKDGVGNLGLHDRKSFCEITEYLQ